RNRLTFVRLDLDPPKSEPREWQIHLTLHANAGLKQLVRRGHPVDQMIKPKESQKSQGEIEVERSR
ncbi:hypothetical protein J6590_003304, partial [Homalodisca vitripennis]